jgi:hypothetical protein
VLVKLLRHVPLDREKSKYGISKLDGKYFISWIKPLVLREPQDGLDPIFRVKEQSATLFVTDTGKERTFLSF